ncbi:octaprenyl diphosphate synthase [Natronospirillum operosum]|uniref:Octaprenyl diphosphate synthase n=1 Tax=Natronospirillum operosum TaxID=2759953 RepID=A0A4Z0WGU7_9GAMM|nr:polyprenyl synthetase family protein [Natronospirillum operosum]TGG94976.1 octaprenyl diphosphate synthase [Natronospirillum operosum]
MQISEINAVVADEFEAVNTEISRELSSDVPLVEHIAEYIVSSGGKRLRPLVTLLTGSALGCRASSLITLAAIIEFLHTATLLHDDVVDTSELRRGKPTANHKWGNAPSVLVGDFLYSRAFQMMVRIGDMAVMERLANATNVIAEGEVLQLMNVRNPDLTTEDYHKVIQGKTAMLFAAASGSAACLASDSDTLRQAAHTYGIELGLAFQIQDDVLDYSGNAETLGKNAGDDLAEGKMTLPLIHTLKHCDADTRQLIRNAIRQGGTDDLAPVLAAVQASKALDFCRGQALQHRQRAIDALADFPASPAREALIGLAELAVDRSS